MPESATNLEYLRHIVELGPRTKAYPQPERGRSILLREPTHTRVKGLGPRKKKRVLREPIARCRGVECAKNSEYNDSKLPILFAVGIIPNARCRRAAGMPQGRSPLHPLFPSRGTYKRRRSSVSLLLFHAIFACSYSMAASNASSCMPEMHVPIAWQSCTLHSLGFLLEGLEGKLKQGRVSTTSKRFPSCEFFWLTL